MPEREPVTDAPEMGFAAPNPRLTPWSHAVDKLRSARTYWLATMRPNGRPHAMPVWGIWQDSEFYFSTGEASRKAKNLALNSNCVVSVGTHALDLTLEGVASRVTDEAMLRSLAEVYTAKYDWPLRVGDGMVYDDDGNGGPLYAVTPKVGFGFGEEDGFTATRWRFE